MEQSGSGIEDLLGTVGRGWVEAVPDFQASLHRTERSRSLVGLFVGAAVYPLFGFLDLAIYPERLVELLLIRLMAVALLVAMGVIVHRARNYRRVVRATAIGYIVPAAGIALMCHLAEGVASPYYAGIPLCTVFLAAFLTWPVSVTVKACSFVLVAYFVPLAWELSQVDLRDFVLHSSFLLGTMVLVVLGMRLRLVLAWQLHLKEQALAQGNRKLADLHELKDRMFQNVSHELRTPLTLILTPLQKRMATKSLSKE